MSNHALLSASSSHRWLNCTPSAVLGQNVPDKESAAAAEGTAAHALCEHKLKVQLGRKSKRPVSEYDSGEMEGFTDDYVEYVLEQLEIVKQTCKDPLILLEERLDFSHYVPDGFGTGDCVIIADDTLHIIDFKYGLGVLVDVFENPQMKLYALGALNAYDSLYDIKQVSMTIFQPRRENVSTWMVPVDELTDWAETELRAKAALAIKGEGDFLPGAHCRFCPVAVKCRARAEEKLKLAESEFQHPPLLSDDEIGAILMILPDLTMWANELQAYALEMAVHRGKIWPGFKVVEGRSNREYADEQKVAEAAIANGYTDIYRQRLITLTDMQRLMGRKKFDAILGKYIIKPMGKPTLVPVSDKKQAMNLTNVKDEFNEITEEKNHDEQE